VDLLGGKLQPHHHHTRNRHLADLLKRESAVGKQQQDRQKQLQAIANKGVTERFGQLLGHLEQQHQKGGGGGSSSSCLRLDPAVRQRANKLLDQLKTVVTTVVFF
jgi:hypothetical protein